MLCVCFVFVMYTVSVFMRQDESHVHYQHMNRFIVLIREYNECNVLYIYLLPGVGSRVKCLDASIHSTDSAQLAQGMCSVELCLVIY